MEDDRAPVRLVKRTPKNKSNSLTVVAPLTKDRLIENILRFFFKLLTTLFYWFIYFYYQILPRFFCRCPLRFSSFWSVKVLYIIFRAYSMFRTVALIVVYRYNIYHLLITHTRVFNINGTHPPTYTYTDYYSRFHASGHFSVTRYIHESSQGGSIITVRDQSSTLEGKILIFLVHVVTCGSITGISAVQYVDFIESKALLK